MANTATRKTAITGFGGSRFNGSIWPYWMLYDTPSGDLALQAPTSGKRSGIIGLSVLIDAAATINIKAASTVIQTFKFAANSGLALPFSPDAPLIYAIGEVDQTLSINSNAALGTFQLFAFEV